MFLSILMPVYKDVEIIHRCIKSILDQKYVNFEQLIGDVTPDDCIEHNYENSIKGDLVCYFSKGYNLVLKDNSGCNYWFVNNDVIDL